MNDLYQYGVYCLGSYCTVLQWIWGGMWDRQIPITHPLHPPPPRKRAGKGRDAQGSERLFIDASTIEGVTVALWLRQWTDVRPTAPALRAPDPHRARERERLEEEDWCCCGHASQGCKQKFFFVVPPLSSHCKWMG